MSADDALDEDARPNQRYDDDEERPRRRRADYDDRARRPRRPPQPPGDATEYLVPTRVSGYSIAACYLGLLGCVPVVGLVFAIIALVCGITALRRRKNMRAPGSYGAVTSDMRAIIGIVLGGFSLLFNVPLAILVIVGAFRS